MKFSKSLLSIFAVVASLAIFAAPASAIEIVKFGLSESGGAEIEFDGTTFFTTSDGDAATTGEQNTNVDFVGFLGGLSDILMGGSFSLNGVTATGSAIVSGLLIQQNTTGGTFSLWDDSNSLLLSGALDSGVITGATGSSVGSFFNTNIATFTGGSLLSIVAPQPAGISIALAGITSGNVSGMTVDQMGNLNPFTGAGDGVIDAQPIPEPATAALILSGLVLGGARKRMKLSAE